MNILLQYWPIASAVISAALMLALLLLSKTYARKEDVEMLGKEVDEMKTQLHSIPTQKEITKVLLELAALRGELQAQSNSFNSVQRNVEMLVENELRGEKN